MSRYFQPQDCPFGAGAAIPYWFTGGDCTWSCLGEHLSVTQLILPLEAAIGRAVTRNGSSASVTGGVRSVCVSVGIHMPVCTPYVRI